MTDIARTENDALIETAVAGVDPNPLEPGKVYGYKFRDHVHTVDLTGDTYRDFPKRKRGQVVVDDVAAFAQYYAKHADEASEVYADIDHGTITAILDAHKADGARWAEHRLILQLRHTEQWKTWAGLNRKFMPQQEFAEFLEDNLVDIAPGGPVDAATLLEIAANFQAKQKVTYSSGTVLASGDIKLNYQEETDASGGAKGTFQIPKTFLLGLAPFDDTDPYKITARFRYRIQHSKLAMGYILDRPQDVVRDAVKNVVAKVEEATSIKVMRGTPAA